MSASLINNEILHFDKKFGIITQNKVILTKGTSKQEKIAFDAIEKVNLIKYRVLYTNILLLTLSLTILASSLLHWHPEKIIIQFFILLGILLLVYSIRHKFYYYRLVIKEKNTSLHTIKASQFDRKQIKKFYFSIVKYSENK